MHRIELYDIQIWEHFNKGERITLLTAMTHEQLKQVKQELKLKISFRTKGHVANIISAGGWGNTTSLFIGIKTIVITVQKAN